MQQSTPASQKLSFLEKFGFGVGDLASNLLFSTFNMFLIFFYTDVVELSGSAIFWIFAVVKIWDVINDPMMGAVADRTHTRWGRYRPYLFLMAIPYGVSAYLLFTVPDLSDTAMVFYCGFTYMLATMMYTAINIPYCALMGVITADVKERALVSQYRFFLAFAGGWVISTFTIPLVMKFGDDPTSPNFNAEIGYDPVVGYPTAMMVFGTLAVGLFFFTFFTTKERVFSVQKKRTPLKQDFRDLAGNFPWLILFISAVFNLGNVAVRNGSMLHYLTYYVQKSDVLLFQVNFGLFDMDVTRKVLFMSFGALLAMLGVLPTKYLCRRFDKRYLLVFFMVMQGLICGVIYFVPGDQYVTILTLHFLASFLMGPGPVIVFSMYADVADYSEWKTDRRATGLIIASILFAIKGGLWLGAQFNALVLWIVDYDKDTVANSPEVINAIALLFTWTPGILAILSGLVILKYPISDSMLEQIQVDLEKRKQSEENSGDGESSQALPDPS